MKKRVEGRLNEKKVGKKRREAEQGEEKQHLAYAWHFTYTILFKSHNDPIGLISPSPYFINEATEAKRG